MKRRTIVVVAVLAAAGLVAFVAYVQGAGPFGKAPSKTAGVEVQCVSMTNGATSEVGCQAAGAATGTGTPDAACHSKKDGKCSGDCTACPGMKQGGCPGATAACHTASAAGTAGQPAACQASATCEGAKSGVCSPATSTVATTSGCPAAQASSAKQGKCGGCPFSTK